MTIIHLQVEEDKKRKNKESMSMIVMGTYNAMGLSKR